jgi:outer membrane biosynthesis protein TonB
MSPLRKTIGGLAVAVALSLSACGSPSGGDNRAVRALDEVATPAPAATTSPAPPSATPATTPPSATPTSHPAPKAAPPRKPTKPVKPTPRNKPKPKPKKSTKPKQSVYYENCDAVRAAGADPIHTGDPGYSRKLDRDGDGVGCER